MRWWKRKPEDRAQWVLDPLVAVGPLRFGMTSGQVEAVLGEGLLGSYQGAKGEEDLQRYSDLGVTAIYQRGHLVAVAIDAMDGPLIRLRDVELIARTPSGVRADIHRLASEDNVAVRVNWSGDPEVAAWGLSMGARPGRGLSAAGFSERKDTMITDALLVCAELAEAPYLSEPVIQWCDVRELESNPGAWPVKPDADRPRWDWTPLERIGPLQFGMNPLQVADALGGEAPAARHGHFPWPFLNKPGLWSVNAERFDEAGVTAHYWGEHGIPRLTAVTVHGRTGPQVSYAGTELIGKKVSVIDDVLCQRAERDEIGLLAGCNGDLGPDGLGMWVRATRAGDAVISEARFCAEGWEDHG
ncbi:hypothetical protein ACTOB_003478 [Actinoplanes oblitus]|uniref:Aminomethyltransferase folate-binding domain-containing protein n=1 Tax=Actinoplanes oblitus TaxID=3040509 RepID=A0ABY8WRU4_9ACTN|nr:hypothetical protein [Actinoplanes oblitus]WIM99813.1 hypothetical protein ACTOB_003478 [Actinoplanes oblitus]